MSIDGQVLVVAFLAISLKLLLWAREADGVDVEDRLRRKAVSGTCDFARKHIQLGPYKSDVRVSFDDAITE